MKKTNFFCVDLGATSGRTILGSIVDGKLEQRELTRFPNNIIQTGGHFFWDIFALYNEVIRGLKVVAEEGIEIASIGIDTWGCDFVIVDRLGRTATYVDSSLNAWIDRATLAERQRFVEAVFSIMTAGDEAYTHDLRTKWRITAPRMARAAMDLEPEMRDVMVGELLGLLKELAPGGE